MERPKRALEYLEMIHTKIFRSRGLYEATLARHGFTKAEAFRCRAYLESCCDDKFKEIVNGIDTKAD